MLRHVGLSERDLKEHGGRFLVRGGTREVPEGQVRGRTVVLEFPSFQAALDCYHSPEYQAAKHLREGKGELDLEATVDEHGIIYEMKVQGNRQNCAVVATLMKRRR